MNYPHEIERVTLVSRAKPSAKPSDSTTAPLIVEVIFSRLDEDTFQCTTWARLGDLKTKIMESRGDEIEIGCSYMNQRTNAVVFITQNGII